MRWRLGPATSLPSAPHGYCHWERELAKGRHRAPSDNCCRDRCAAQTVRRPRTNAHGSMESAVQFLALRDIHRDAGASRSRWRGTLRIRDRSPAPNRRAIRRHRARALQCSRKYGFRSMRAPVTMRPSCVTCDFEVVRWRPRNRRNRILAIQRRSRPSLPQWPRRHFLRFVRRRPRSTGRVLLQCRAASAPRIFGNISGRNFCPPNPD